MTAEKQSEVHTKFSSMLHGFDLVDVTGTKRELVSEIVAMPSCRDPYYSSMMRSLEDPPFQQIACRTQDHATVRRLGSWAEARRKQVRIGLDSRQQKSMLSRKLAPY